MNSSPVYNALWCCMVKRDVFPACLFSLLEASRHKDTCLMCLTCQQIEPHSLTVRREEPEQKQAASLK